MRLIKSLIKSIKFIIGIILILISLGIGYQVLETRLTYLVLMFLGFSLILWALLATMKKENVLAKMADIILKGIYVLFALGLVLFIVTEWLVIKNSTSDKNEVLKDCKYAVVLGCQVNGEQPSPLLYFRIVAAYDFLQINENAKAIVTGGQGPGEDISEAETMRRYLEDMGISPDRIIMEDKATDTYQSFKNAKEIVENLEGSSNVKIAVVTNDFHLFRSKKLARDFGFDAYGVSATTPDVNKPFFFAKEFVSVVMYWLHI